MVTQASATRATRARRALVHAVCNASFFISNMRVAAASSIMRRVSMGFMFITFVIRSGMI